MHWIIAAILACAMPSAFAAPAAELWPIWNRADERNLDGIDHSSWAGVLANNLVTDDASGVHLFRYGSISTADRKVLGDYLDRMQAIDPRVYARSEQFAYWINLYNALTVRVVLQNPQKDSITRMGKSFFSVGPWNDPVAEVAGETLTLNDIEHRILRPIWRDHRIHYAVNCASIGCPNLAAEPYAAQKMEIMLDAAERAYLGHPRGVAFQDDRIYLSRIFDWYRDDFAKSERDLLEYLAERVEGAVAARLRAYSGRIKYRYDWDLNAAG